MGKTERERLWWLKGFSDGWSIGRPLLVGIKKWDAHTAALVKRGYLEADGYGLHRITDAGRRALSEGDRHD